MGTGRKVEKTPSGWHRTKIDEYEVEVDSARPGYMQIREVGKPGIMILTRNHLYQMLSFSEEVEAERRQKQEKKRGKKVKNIGGYYV